MTPQNSATATRSKRPGSVLPGSHSDIATLEAAAESLTRLGDVRGSAIPLWALALRVRMETTDGD